MFGRCMLDQEDACSADIRMIRWIYSYNRKDKVKNEVIREKVRVTPIEDKIRESWLRWFRHVKKRAPNAPVRRCEKITMT